MKWLCIESRVHPLLEVFDSLLPPGHRGDHRNSEESGQFFHVYGDPLFRRRVHHVQGQDKGRAGLQHLDSQVEASLEVRSVGHDDGQVGPAPEKEIRRDLLVEGGGAETVYPREVHHLHLAVAHPEAAFLPLHGDAGPVAHVLVRPRQGVEQARLARIGVSREGYRVAHHLHPPLQPAQPFGRTNTAFASSTLRLSSYPLNHTDTGSLRGAFRSTRISVPGTSPISRIRRFSPPSPPIFETTPPSPTARELSVFSVTVPQHPPKAPIVPPPISLMFNISNFSFPLKKRTSRFFFRP
ncbi:hypothetical protein SDC9_105076 [bioreactor metagenome]|uniref:Uncharacterized protein n=1 Tax=bioreactor metagenome TaxID=1076179 RepID=A0A645AYC3_9ZZZZ